MKKHAAPIIAAVLLLLPMLYVGSYLALVLPKGRFVPYVGDPLVSRSVEVTHYRCGGERLSWFYWPLEKIDRKVRPGAWEDPRFLSIERNLGGDF